MAGNTVRFPTTKRKEIKNDNDKAPIDICPVCKGNYIFTNNYGIDVYIRCEDCGWSKKLD